MANPSRRSILLGLGAMAAGSAAPKMAFSRARPLFFKRIGKPIGLQLYMLGNDIGRDLDATFAAVAQIGYREVELPNLMGKPAAEIAAAAARAGIAIRSLHVPLVRGASAAGAGGGVTFGSSAQQLADTLGALGARWAVAPILLIPANFRPAAGETFGRTLARSAAEAGADLWKESAALLNDKGQALRPFGINVGYHNHNIEFAPIGKTTGWDILWRETQPGLVHFELDLGWIATAGLDPARFLDHTRGRVKLLHVKDVAADNPHNFTIDMKPAEVGSGVLDWARIMAAAKRAGIEHYLVEQEPPFAIPRIEAAAKSFEFLSRLRA